MFRQGCSWRYADIFCHEGHSQKFKQTFIKIWATFYQCALLVSIVKFVRCLKKPVILPVNLDKHIKLILTFWNAIKCQVGIKSSCRLLHVKTQARQLTHPARSDIASIFTCTVIHDHLWILMSLVSLSWLNVWVLVETDSAVVLWPCKYQWETWVQMFAKTNKSQTNKCQRNCKTLLSPETGLACAEEWSHVSAGWYCRHCCFCQQAVPVGLAASWRSSAFSAWHRYG